MSTITETNLLSLTAHYNAAISNGREDGLPGNSFHAICMHPAVPLSQACEVHPSRSNMTLAMLSRELFRRSERPTAPRATQVKMLRVSVRHNWALRGNGGAIKGFSYTAQR